MIFKAYNKYVVAYWISEKACSGTASTSSVIPTLFGRLNVGILAHQQQTRSSCTFLGLSAATSGNLLTKLGTHASETVNLPWRWPNSQELQQPAYIFPLPREKKACIRTVKSSPEPGSLCFPNNYLKYCSFWTKVLLAYCKSWHYCMYQFSYYSFFL